MTIRVAWELYAAGVRPSARILAEARQHVLLSLPSSFGRMQAEELAGTFTLEFLARVQKGRYRAPPRPRNEVTPRPSWRDRVLESLDPIGEVVLRLGYGDGLSLPQIERITRVDRAVLAGAQEGVRAALRQVATEDGVGCPHERDAFERLLSRVALLPSVDCRGGVEAASPLGMAHADRCPRCARGVRLIRAGVLAPSELVAPEVLPRTEPVQVLCLHLHPDARHHRKGLVEALAPGAMRADDDAVFVDLDRIADHVAVLHHLALEGGPPRNHIRGALVRGAGVWSTAGLLGPVAGAAVEVVRSRQWGEVDGCGTLPEPLPDDPPAARWWVGAGVACAAAALAGLLAFQRPAPDPTFPVLASFETVDVDTVATRFDVSDQAFLLVVALQDGVLHTVHASDSVFDKADFATGAGDFRFEADGQRLLVASSATPFDTLGPALSAAAGAPDPLAELGVQLTQDRDDVDVRVQPAPEVP